MSRAILDAVAVVRGNMVVVRDDVHVIQQDTRQMPQIMAELTSLRAILMAGYITTATRDQNYVLERYLDSLMSYAGTVCNLCGTLMWALAIHCPAQRGQRRWPGGGEWRSGGGGRGHG